MGNVAIRVERVSKKYRLGANAHSYKTLRESLTGIVSKPLHMMSHLTRQLAQSETRRQRPSDLWALKDVSFEVKQGEVLGIIGHNGAGKSTLLKVLSQITEPTQGRISIKGRVASLLEVGTGFHPELTGRENVFLNGAILGMSRREMAHKFDEIVSFAEVEKFIDTPVKRYSSGMYLRLAFSVAAHLDPEILILDEVLAVGDARFRKKSQDKMRQVAKNGQTVLLVSHDLYAVQVLCRRCILLERGQIVQDGSTDAVIAQYRSLAEGHIEHQKQPLDQDSPEVEILSTSVNGFMARDVILAGTFDLELQWSFRVNEPVDVGFGVSITASGGEYITGLSTVLDGTSYQLAPGVHDMSVSLPKLTLASGLYIVRLAIMDRDGSHTYAYRSPVATLSVETPFSFDGLIKLPHEWREPSSLDSQHQITVSS